MTTPLSKIATSLRQIGEIQVSEVDFIALLNKDIHDLEIRRSLTRLGNIKVTDWNFGDIIPKVKELGAREIDVVNLVKRTAAYRVMDWDFRSTHTPASKAPSTSENSLQPLITRLTRFLEFLVGQLAPSPAEARITVSRIAPGVINFKVIMPRKELPHLIGINGQTASAIRHLMKSTAAEHCAQVLLQIVAREDAPPAKPRA